MSWGRQDDQFDDDPDLSDMCCAAIALHWCAISWCNRNLTDGRVPKARARQLKGGDDPQAIADLLKAHVEIGGGDPWWIDMGSHYQIRNFLKYNKSREEVVTGSSELSHKRAMAGRLGGIRSGQSKREAKQNPSKTEANGLANDEAKGDFAQAKTKQKQSPEPVSRIPSQIPAPAAARPRARGPGSGPWPERNGFGESSDHGYRGSGGGEAPEADPHEQVAAADELRSLGVNDRVATDLAAKYSARRIRQQIAWLPFRNGQDKAAVLVASICDGYQEPPDAAAAAAEMSRKVEADRVAAERRAEHKRLDDALAMLAEPERAELSKRAEDEYIRESGLSPGTVDQGYVRLMVKRKMVESLSRGSPADISDA